MLSSPMLTWSAWELLSTAALAYVGWTMAKGVYNLYLHPLAKFPGPRWAAFSPWWKTKLEAFQGRNLTDELFRLHEKYGERKQGE